ncbi:MAG: Chitinase [Myxococcales bacterium]|nr:Chitinase [Myxococcales bacterium]
MPRRQTASDEVDYPSMKRAHGLVEISRRELCVGGCVSLLLAACTDGSSGAVETGPLGGGGHGTQPDAGTTGGSDGSVANPDGGVAATCGPTAIDVGAASSFVLNTPKYFSTGRCFIVRDSGGLYAVSSLCTHEGAINGVSSGHFLCPRHGATFTFNGNVIGGPVSTGLKHFAMCTLANGHVGVTPSMVVAQATRLVA